MDLTSSQKRLEKDRIAQENLKQGKKKHIFGVRKLTRTILTWIFVVLVCAATIIAPIFSVKAKTNYGQNQVQPNTHIIGDKD